MLCGLCKYIFGCFLPRNKLLLLKLSIFASCGRKKERTKKVPQNSITGLWGANTSKDDVQASLVVGVSNIV
jgi:hypothetical protein